jgi:excisionase family DNA binding protein
MSRSARLARIKRYREELIAEIGYLTIEETARALRRGRRYVAALLDSGLLPHSRDGKRRKIRVVDLEAFMAKNSVPSATEPDVRMRHRHGHKSPLPALKPSDDPDIAALFE